MAKKKTNIVCLQRGNYNGFGWELKQNLNNRKELRLSILEFETVEAEKEKTEIRDIPSEENVKREMKDKDGKTLKKDGKIQYENVIKKTTVRKEVKVLEMVRETKKKQIKEFTFYFRPFHFQLMNTVKNYLKTL